MPRARRTPGQDIAEVARKLLIDDPVALEQVGHQDGCRAVRLLIDTGKYQIVRGVPHKTVVFVVLVTPTGIEPVLQP